MRHNLSEPIAVLGATGFIGQNLLRYLEGYNVIASNSRMWEEDLKKKPRTIFNCIGYGGYRTQRDVPSLTYHANLILLYHILSALPDGCTFINAGTSCEYAPTSHYAISKRAASDLIFMMGKNGMKCCNLRLYHVYGRGEPGFRLVPTLIKEAKQGKLPPLGNKYTPHNFIHVDDVCRAFGNAAENLQPKDYGESFDIGSKDFTYLEEMAQQVIRQFDLKVEPQYGSFFRQEKMESGYYPDLGKTVSSIGFSAKIGIEEGLLKTTTY